MLRLNPHLADNLAVGNLPVLPEALVQLVDALDATSENPSAERLSRHFFADPGLAARVVGLACACGFQRLSERGPVLGRVLNSIGIEAASGIVVSATTASLTAEDSQLAPYLRRFSLEALEVALLAGSIASQVDYPVPDEAHVAGLFHNLGRIALASADAGAYGKVLRRNQGGEALESAEQAEFGLDQAEVGAGMLDSWGLVSFAAHAVRFHREDLEALRDAHPLVQIVHVAHRWVSAGETPPDSDEVAAHTELLDLPRASVLTRLRGQAREEAAALLGGALAAPEAPPARIDERQGRLFKSLGDHARIEVLRRLLGSEAGEEGILRSTVKGVRALFGVDRLLVFLPEPDGRLLRGRDPVERSGLASDLRVRLRPEGSCVARAHLSRTAVAWTPEAVVDGEILDHQILRLLNAQALFCVPLCAGEARVGALVAGVTAEALGELQEDEAAWLSLAAEAARALEGHRARQRREQSLVTEAVAELQARTRQLVHEANNPLSVLRNYLSILRNKLPDPSAPQELAMLEEEVGRVGQLLLQLGAFSPPVEGDYATDLNQLVTELVQLLVDTGFTPDHIETHLRLDTSLPPIRTDRNALKQIVLNLLKNAIEAMDEGGEIWLRTRDYIYLDDREYVEIGISDSGPGIPPHVMARLFQPVESTKGPEHGGLGLSIVRNLVRELGGLISCRSSESDGTAFRILLPRELD